MFGILSKHESHDLNSCLHRHIFTNYFQQLNAFDSKNMTLFSVCFSNNLGHICKLAKGHACIVNIVICIICQPMAILTIIIQPSYKFYVLF